MFVLFAFQHYPEDMKYQALYPSSESSEKSVARRGMLCNITVAINLCFDWERLFLMYYSRPSLIRNSFGPALVQISES